jgi:phage gp36-like protein
MAFIEKADMKRAILTEELDAIVRGDDTVILQTISAAVSEMRGYLYNNYDVNTIFEKTGDERHQLLVQYCVDISIYYLVAATQGGQAVDDRKSRYDRACKWLRMVRDDDHYADLPRRETTVEVKIHAGASGAPKRNNYF